ncbi:MAG: hypothetical protein KGL39_03635 [Patescibacteria group bacterium]|nr:hypothetical protein [Patescibacteria group bacterium]
MITMQPYQLTNGTAVKNAVTGAFIPNDPLNPDWQRYQAWVAAGNTADAVPALSAADQAAANFATRKSAGLQIVSTGTPALNATYSLDDATRTNLSGIAAAIANGHGLPGSGSTFFFQDASYAPHSFDQTSILNLGVAIRDYYYALTVAEATEAAGGTPNWPTQPATIP